MTLIAYQLNYSTRAKCQNYQLVIENLWYGLKYSETLSHFLAKNLIKKRLLQRFSLAQLKFSLLKLLTSQHNYHSENVENMVLMIDDSCLNTFLVHECPISIKSFFHSWSLVIIFAFSTPGSTSGLPFFRLVSSIVTDWVKVRDTFRDALLKGKFEMK